MTETCQFTAMALRAALLPAFIAFLFAPAASLRAWTAVKALPAPEPLEVASLKSFKRRRMLHLLAIVLIVSVVEYTFLAHATTDIISNLVIGSFVFLNTVSTVSVLDDWTTPFGPYLWAAYRAPGTGRVLWRIVPGSVRPIKLIGVSAIAYYVNWQALQTPVFAAWPFLVTTAVIYRFSSSGQWKTISIRGVMIALLSWLAVSFAITGLAIFFLFSQESSGSSPSTETDPDASLSPLAIRLIQMVSGALWAAAPGILIAACYRFDHSLSVEDQASPAVETIETTVCSRRRRFMCPSSATASTSSAPRTVKGVLLPTSNPASFAKPTYLAAILSYFFVQVGATVVYGFASWIPEELRTDMQLLDVVALTLTLPAMVVAVLLTAWMKGNARALWRYREEWLVAPAVVEVGNIRLPEEDAVSVLLPPYEEMSKENTPAPAYEVAAQDVKV